MNIEDYRAVKICDSGDYTIQYGMIMLANKHTIKEFQDVVYKIKDRFYNEGNYEWQVEDILTDKELEQFDWFEIPTDCYDCVEV